MTQMDKASMMVKGGKAEGDEKQEEDILSYLGSSGDDDDDRRKHDVDRRVRETEIIRITE